MSGDPSIGRRGGRRAGAGRKKGVPNKTSGELKNAVLKTFKKVGGIKYLERIAREQPAVFCQLIRKLLPTEIATADGPLKSEIILKWITPEMVKARNLPLEMLPPATTPGQD